VQDVLWVPAFLESTQTHKSIGAILNSNENFDSRIRKNELL
jgi:hypothetical protein